MIEGKDLPFQSHDYGVANLVAQYEAQRRRRFVAAFQTYNSDTPLVLSDFAQVQVIDQVAIPSEETVSKLSNRLDGEILVQAEIVVFGDKTNEGQLIQAVTIAWEEIIKEIARDPEFLNRVPWRMLEELIAGAYEREGWPEVILTPRSGDMGRDVIATKPGFGSIKIFDQVKAYAPGHKVTAEEVRALLGVLQIQGNVSKGIVITTSDFAPNIFKEVGHLMPHRLELKNGRQLREWLLGLPDKE